MWLSDRRTDPPLTLAHTATVVNTPKSANSRGVGRCLANRTTSDATLAGRGPSACVGAYYAVVRVSRELHDKVLLRDGRCFMSRPDVVGSPVHQCADQWGTQHPSTELNKLSVDHVHMGLAMMGKRAPDDERHLVAMCHNSNIAGPSRAVREAERAYLAGLYG